MALTKLVGSEAPFHNTVEFAANPEPITVSVNAGLPAGAVDGLRVLMAGGAFAAVIAKAVPPDTALPVLTVTVAPLWEAMRLAATDAIS